MIDNLRQIGRAVLNSYSQVFFSDNRIFALILLIVSFIDFYGGLFGLMAVVITNITGFLMGFDKRTVTKGLYGFNSLLVGLGLGIYYQPGLTLVLIIALSSILTLFIAVSLQGVIGKYGLPYLSVPFIIGAWVVTLAAREFTSLGISERGIYTINQLYTLGGNFMVTIYDWWNNLEIFRPVRIYFISMGAILFQYNLFAGILIAAGLLYHSRISFSLSIIGFLTAYVFYELTGTDISDLNYSYIGFNYILTSIAIGGFFIIPSSRSYFWVILMVPVVALLTISLSSVFAVFRLPVYALPFNMVVLLFLYALKFRVKPSPKLSEVFIQQNTPEKNLYSYHNDRIRFRHGEVTVKLPFYGIWEVSQSHDGEYTHKGEWRHAWDFVITDKNGSQYKGEGNEPADYYCYNKPVLAVADGTVEHVSDNIPDNIIGTPNIRDNWGNTVIIKHKDFLYSSVSHLIPGSVKVKEGDKVRAGDPIGKCGNSGRSPYPHLHFQMQATPYIGSKTTEYPLGYYISHREKEYKLNSFNFPDKGEKLSNIEVNELLNNALEFIPGKVLEFKGSYNGKQFNENWEVGTDEYNNAFIRCMETDSVAYFENDGYMLMFRHYEGSKNDLLYWVFMALYKVQQGYYEGLKVEDEYPLNLFLRKRVLFLQDFFAPFFTFLKSRYIIEYKNIDSDVAPTFIQLKAIMQNSFFDKILREVASQIEIREKGLNKITIEGKGINIFAECTD